MAAIGKVNTHGYDGQSPYRGDDRAPLKTLVTKSNKKFWDSEYGESDATGLSLAESIALDINQMGVSAFVYWQALDSGAWGLIQSNPGDNWIGTPNPKYYVMLQYSRHIRPGMTILSTDDSNTVMAFDTSSKLLVLVTVNSGDSASTVTFDLSSFTTVAGPITAWTTETSGTGALYKSSKANLSAITSTSCDGERFGQSNDSSNVTQLLDHFEKRLGSPQLIMTSTLEVPARPGQVTTEFLQQVLGPLYPSERVVDFQWEPMNIGVIAEVVIFTVQFDLEGSNEAKTQRRFVGKFLRPEFPFESMFAVESKFYNEFTTKAGDAAMKNSAAVVGFPFAIPTAIFTSNVLIVLMFVEAVKTFTCVDGSPPHHIPMLVTKLAQMHARFWNHDGDGLATPAGIGSQLTGEEKRLQFPGCWKDYLDDVVLENSDKTRLTALCQRLSHKADLLKEVHDIVDNGPSSLIHGDFHIANMLLPTDDTDEVTWLLDWATCGRGNPLRDLAFFFIVSVQASHRRVQEATCLEMYHKALTAEKEDVCLPLDKLHQQYKMCVLNQFVILVVYDSLSKSLAANAKTERLREELNVHFREVNHRACLSVLDNVSEKDFELLECDNLASFI
ncbi:Hypothetical protein PHPALM_37530 [Phytophthora palmivora]|uniref:CHK kinase-like domain-containing protein n=1 Tax=Phytophthora palmivora TaxID=4796 RepID=A0A2P4WX67_9STRA|nr:Hypothetical protein PHPALM_37530 [Phytophthora palmivora]